MPKQVFLARFELVVAHFCPPKIPKRLESGRFWDKKWVEIGSKMCISKNDPGAFRVPNQVDVPVLSLWQSILAPPKSQNALKMGCFATKNG